MLLVVVVVKFVDIFKETPSGANSLHQVLVFLQLAAAMSSAWPHFVSANPWQLQWQGWAWIPSSSNTDTMVRGHWNRGILNMCIGMYIWFEYTKKNQLYHIIFSFPGSFLVILQALFMGALNTQGTTYIYSLRFRNVKGRGSLLSMPKTCMKRDWHVGGGYQRSGSVDQGLPLRVLVRWFAISV